MKGANFLKHSGRSSGYLVHLNLSLALRLILGPGQEMLYDDPALLPQSK